MIFSKVFDSHGSTLQASFSPSFVSFLFHFPSFFLPFFFPVISIGFSFVSFLFSFSVSNSLSSVFFWHPSQFLPLSHGFKLYIFVFLWCSYRYNAKIYKREAKRSKMAYLSCSYVLAIVAAVAPVSLALLDVLDRWLFWCVVCFLTCCFEHERREEDMATPLMLFSSSVGVAA